MSDALMIEWDEYGREFFFNARKAGVSGHQLWVILTKLAEHAQVIALAETECLRRGLEEELR